MRRIDQLLLLTTAASYVSAADAPRPRGVGPELAKHYKETDTFACIYNPSIKLSTSQINDDFCDCPDGSDEPGTAACAHLSYFSPKLASHNPVRGANNTLALPGFYCKNKGHIPSYLPLTNVNDGVCDYESCCDGSDEYGKVGGVSCPDKCKEIGKEWRKKDDSRQKSMSSALKKRQELVTEAGRLKKEVEDKIADLGVQIQASEIKVKNLGDSLAEEERKARGKIVKAPGAAGKTVILAGLAKQRVEELRTALDQVLDVRDETAKQLDELRQIMATFKEEYNPNFNDEGVKRAVRAWEDYVTSYPETPKSTKDGALRDEDLSELTKPDSETNVINWEEWERADEVDDTDLLYQFEAYLPLSARLWIDSKLKALRLFMIDNGVIAAATSKDGGEDPAVAAARSGLQGAESTLRNQQNDLASAKEDVAKDYGVDEVFRALKGSCVSKDSGEYTYEICFMGQAKQRSKKGGGDTNMGNFARFDATVVDDELPPDGKGLGSGERITMRFENGAGCWNGPSRSTTAVLACAEEPEIWKITEEEKCVYRMEVGTPAVCEKRRNGGAAGGQKERAAKDEL